MKFSKTIFPQAIFLLLALIAVVSFFALSSKNVKGQASGGIGFGGVVTASYPCPCSGNFLLTVVGPKGGQFVYYPGTQAFLSYNLPMVGVGVVGNYTPGGVCLIPIPYGCTTAGFPIGTISSVVGTSPIPSSGALSF